MYEEWLVQNGYDADRLYNESELRSLNEDLLFETANLSRRATKLPYVVWLDSIGTDRDNEHTFSPRIKIQVPGMDGWVPVTISDDPEVPDSVMKNGEIKIPKFKEVREWIIAYKKVLLAHFFREIDDNQATSLLLSVDKAEEAEIKLGEYLSSPPQGSIEWFYNTTEGVFEAEVNDDSGEVIEKSVALTKYAMWKEIQELKSVYEIEDGHIKYLGEK